MRDQHRLRTPDSLLLATALEHSADAFLTNDTRLGKLRIQGISAVVLDRFITV